jgi:histidyl-tRNA synthetase
MNDKLPTQPYKGVRDFYPEDMAVQQYIFNVWASTAESFGFQQYDASVLEPAAIYKAKGAENEELVNEQTYTFTDRGGREVTLRPEMTPTVARMIAGRWRDLAGHAPVRWYSIPNLFRYERAQRGRLREHWQLNCDTFGTNNVAVDIEIIALAYQVFKNFGATEEMFTIHVNNRATMQLAYQSLGIEDTDTITAITRLNDRKDKVDDGEYRSRLTEIVSDAELAETIKHMVETTDGGENQVVAGLKELGITNVVLDRSLARGFDYYTGTIFEFKDNHPDNHQTILGGGRYDNLTELFGTDPVSGIGFGLGDVRMLNFLESHNLLPTNLTNAVDVMVIAMDEDQHQPALALAQRIRESGQNVAVNVSGKKVGDIIGKAAEQGVPAVMVVGEDEVNNQTYTLKTLASGEEKTGSLDELFTM